MVIDTLKLLRSIALEFPTWRAYLYLLDPSMLVIRMEEPINDLRVEHYEATMPLENMTGDRIDYLITRIREKTQQRHRHT